MGHESLPADRFYFIGPSLGGRHRTDDTVDRLAEEAGDRPIIYASLGTLFNDFTKFYLDCIQAFGDQPVEVVMDLGSRFDHSKFGRILGNFHIYNSVNQVAVRPHFSLHHPRRHEQRQRSPLRPGAHGLGTRGRQPASRRRAGPGAGTG